MGLRWSDLGGARVGIWGLGTEGRATRRRLEAMGVEPVLVDDAPASAEVLTLAAGGFDALLSCEIVVKAPGVSRYRPEVEALQAADVAVVGGLGLWMESVDRDRVICVTGTKGKSTTVSVAGHLLERLGRTCFVGGNIGRPPFDPDAPTDVDAWIIETSSFQVTDLWSAPPVVAVTSLHPDHLDWHGSFEQYAVDKLSLCTKPGVRHVIANGRDPMLRDRSGLLGPAPTWVTEGDGPAEAWIGALGLRGAHNRLNALMAQACLTAFGVDEAGDPTRLAQAAEGFAGLPSRLSSIGTIDGVEFVDDSLSTNVLPTIAAVSVFPDRRVALLVGGFDRHIDYGPLAEHLRNRDRPLLLLALPDSGPRIAAAVANGAPAPAIEVIETDDLDDAVSQAFAWARPDGVVLLSPAAPSFGRFANYADRADAFRRAMERCR